MAKSIIYYHRAYRKITGSGKIFSLELLIISLPLSLLTFYLYPFITERMSLLAQAILSHYYPSGTIKVMIKSFLMGDAAYVSMPGAQPSYLTAVVNLAVSLALILILPRVKVGKNVAIYFLFLAAINLASSLFFVFSFADFPYSVTKFSELYIKSEISMWLFIPFILGMAILLLPAPIFPKILLIVLALVYSIIFGTLRYIIFLFIVSKLSIIYMALLFFAFGPLIDFVYIVGIFSYYNSKLAWDLQESKSVWKWSY
jgi:hypothetical protein